MVWLMPDHLVESDALRKIDASGESILPTGKLRYDPDCDTLFQKVTAIRHKEYKGKPVGIEHVWIPVPVEILFAIRRKQD